MPLFQAHRAEIFPGTFDFNVREALSAEERAASARLRERLGAPYTLNLGIYRGDELAGWSFGWQESAEKYYMTNTGIFPQHQGKGIYSALLPRILDILRGEGFQIVTSRHTATNNRVLVPKLKAGFIISGFEISDVFGLLVHLSYFFNPVRRKVMDVRAGQARPDEDVRRYLSLE
jgi:GNAT superfamily N-acetyltransferase